MVKNESADPNFKKRFSEIAKLPKVGDVITNSTGETECIGSTVGRILTNRRTRMDTDMLEASVKGGGADTDVIRIYFFDPNSKTLSPIPYLFFPKSRNP